ncbi:MAG: hypothetical protein ACYDBX_03915 [Patescibacteria group bacterium]
MIESYTERDPEGKTLMGSYTRRGPEILVESHTKTDPSGKVRKTFRPRDKDMHT